MPEAARAISPFSVCTSELTPTSALAIDEAETAADLAQVVHRPRTSIPLVPSGVIIFTQETGKGEGEPTWGNGDDQLRGRLPSQLPPMVRQQARTGSGGLEKLPESRAAHLCVRL
jgi:hypothetical protein